MSSVETMKLTAEMELEALQQVFARQPRGLFLNEGQRRHIRRVTEDRLRVLAEQASRDGQRPGTA
jgi:hypothetical protein